MKTHLMALVESVSKLGDTLCTKHMWFFGLLYKVALNLLVRNLLDVFP